MTPHSWYIYLACFSIAFTAPFGGPSEAAAAAAAVRPSVGVYVFWSSSLSLFHCTSNNSSTCEIPHNFSKEKAAKCVMENSTTKNCMPRLSLTDCKAADRHQSPAASLWKQSSPSSSSPYHWSMWVSVWVSVLIGEASSGDSGSQCRLARLTLECLQLSVQVMRNVPSASLSASATAQQQQQQLCTPTTADWRAFY